MIGKTTVLIAALITTPALAALSGFYDSAAKISAILQSGVVADALHQAPIGAITNTGTAADGADEWTVMVQECDLIVRVIGTPPAGMGKTTYRVEVTAPCQ